MILEHTLNKMIQWNISLNHTIYYLEFGLTSYINIKISLSTSSEDIHCFVFYPGKQSEAQALSLIVLNIFP